MIFKIENIRGFFIENGESFVLMENGMKLKTQERDIGQLKIALRNNIHASLLKDKELFRNEKRIHN